MENIFLILLLTFLASFVGTLTGFGTSTILVPIISFILPVPQTLLFVGFIHWFGNIWKIIFFKKGVNLKLIFLFGIPGIVISFFAAKLPFLISANLLVQLLGAFLIFYSLVLLVKSDWKLKASNSNAIIGGMLTGFVSGVFGVGGAIRSTFLASYNLKKEIFIFTSGVIAFLIDTTRILQYLTETSLTQNWIVYLVLSIPVTLLGAYLAKQYINKISQARFRTIVLIGLLLIGLRYLVFGQVYL